jgi:protein-disulfide isomerase
LGFLLGFGGESSGGRLRRLVVLGLLLIGLGIGGWYFLPGDWVVKRAMYGVLHAETIIFDGELELAYGSSSSMGLLGGSEMGLKFDFDGQVDNRDPSFLQTESRMRVRMGSGMGGLLGLGAGLFSVEVEFKQVDGQMYGRVTRLPTWALELMGNSELKQLGEIKDKWLQVDMAEIEKYWVGSDFEVYKQMQLTSDKRRQFVAIAEQHPDLLSVAEVLPDKKINGQMMHHYRLAIDKGELTDWYFDTVVAWLGEDWVAEQGTEQELYDDLSEAMAKTSLPEIEVMIGRWDKQLRQVGFTYAPDSSSDYSRTEITGTYNLQTNQPVAIEAPAEIYSLLEMMAVITGKSGEELEEEWMQQLYTREQGELRQIVRGVRFYYEREGSWPVKIPMRENRQDGVIVGKHGIDLKTSMGSSYQGYFPSDVDERDYYIYRTGDDEVVVWVDSDSEYWETVEYKEVISVLTPTPTGPLQPAFSARRVVTPAALQRVIGLQLMQPDDHVWGDRNAPVVLFEYTDIECPFCEQFHPRLKEVVDEYDGEVAWVFRHFPLSSFHPRAKQAAVAAECVAEQSGGETRFWDFLAVAFEAEALNDDALGLIAQAVGANTGSFESCLDSGIHLDRVERDVQSGQAVGVTGTPTTFIWRRSDGQSVKIPGAFPKEQVKQRIDELLRN